jgi:hypothetical protein
MARGFYDVGIGDIGPLGIVRRRPGFKPVAARTTHPVGRMDRWVIVVMDDAGLEDDGLLLISVDRDDATGSANWAGAAFDRLGEAAGGHS